jgi:hypothetical protein
MPAVALASASMHNIQQQQQQSNRSISAFGSGSGEASENCSKRVTRDERKATTSGINIMKDTAAAR